MSRTAFLALVLAALSVSSANASPAPSAKSHKTAPADASSHRKTQHPTHVRAENAAHSPGTYRVGHPAARKPAASVAKRTPVVGVRLRARRVAASEIKSAKAAQSARAAQPHAPKAAPAPRVAESSAHHTYFKPRGSRSSARKASDAPTKAAPDVQPAVSAEKVAGKLDVSLEIGGDHTTEADTHADSKALTAPFDSAQSRLLKSSPEIKPTPIALSVRTSAAAEADQPATTTDVASIAPESAIPARQPRNSGYGASIRDASLRKTRLVMPPALVGSHESLTRQNEKSDAEGLERIEDEDDLADRIAHKLLVPVPTSAALAVNGNLPVNHRYCRPWTAIFLADLARSHDEEFHRPLEVSSAVRTVEYQKRLMGTNGNAAAAEGDIVSPHLTGATIDIAKYGLSREEMAWMRTRLLALEQAGKIDVEEEFQQACFHITVYKNYVPPRPAQKAAAPKTGQTKTGQPTAGSAAKAPDSKARKTNGQPRPDAIAEIASIGR